MFKDTISTFELIEENVDSLFKKNPDLIRAAIKEHLRDFISHTDDSEETDPEKLISRTPKENFQHAGLYGAQLDLKEKQVTDSNKEFRESLQNGRLSFFWGPFKKWIDRINNFLGSLASATGLGEALKELKDCLRDELPEND